MRAGAFGCLSVAVGVGITVRVENCGLRSSFRVMSRGIVRRGNSSVRRSNVSGPVL